MRSISSHVEPLYFIMFYISPILICFHKSCPKILNGSIFLMQFLFMFLDISVCISNLTLVAFDLVHKFIDLYLLLIHLVVFFCYGGVKFGFRF
jgi:hypothetical protein